MVTLSDLKTPLNFLAQKKLGKVVSCCFQAGLMAIVALFILSIDCPLPAPTSVGHIDIDIGSIRSYQ